MSVVLTQRIEWDMGHRLGDGYLSKCRHAHGHRYVAELSFIASTLDEFGMVLDFGEIKRLAKGWIDEHIDHAFLVYEKDLPLLDFLRSETIVTLSLVSIRRSKTLRVGLVLNCRQ